MTQATAHYLAQVQARFQDAAMHATSGTVARVTHREATAVMLDTRRRPKAVAIVPMTFTEEGA